MANGGPRLDSLSAETVSDVSMSEESTSEEEEDQRFFTPNVADLSDDEVKEFVVEEPHRVGWPRLLPPPTCFEGGWGKTYTTPHQSAAVCGILESLSIRHHGLDVGAYTICNANKDPTPLTTLMVQGYTKDASGSWSEAVIQIARLLPNMISGSNKVNAVEICEKGWPLQAPIENKDPVLDVWESTLAPAIVDILEQPRILWQTISLARFASFASFASLTPGPVTLVIAAADAADQQWEAEVLPQIKATMKEMRCGVEHVSLWQMQAMGRPHSNIRQNLFPSSRRKKQWMLIGDGIAAKGEKNQLGTVGGMVTLRAASGKQTDSILTSFSAVSDRKLCAALAPKPPFKRLQSRCFAENPSPFAVKVPADMDTTVILKDGIFDRRARVFQKYLEYMKNKSRVLLDMDAEREERVMGILKMLQDQKVRSLQTKAKVEGYQKLPAGTVKATSGHQAHSDEAGRLFGLGWALVNVDPARKCLPFVFNRDRPRRNLHFEGIFGLPAWATSSVHRFTAPTRDMDAVVKLGRMTGWSTGRLNHATVFCKSCPVTGEEDFVFRCHQVFPLFGANGVLGRFADGGDCGSVVKNQTDGSWIGLLIGTHPCGWGLMPSIDKVLESIEKVTGEKVVQPEPVAALDGRDAV